MCPSPLRRQSQIRWVCPLFAALALTLAAGLAGRHAIELDVGAHWAGCSVDLFWWPVVIWLPMNLPWR